MVVTLMLSLVSCGKSAESKYYGTWEIVSAENDGAKFTLDELEALGDDSLSGISLILKEGRKACILENGKGDIVDWSVTSGGLKIGVLDCKVENDTILVEKNKVILHFQKTSDSQEIPNKKKGKKSENKKVEISESGLIDGDFTYNVLSDGTVEIIKYNGSESSVTISSEIDDKKVSKIGNGAFENCTSIKEITNWADITSIGDNAFKGCINLEEFDFPSDTTYIGKSAFENCINLRTITIWGDIEAFGDSAFKGCTSLEEVSIPSSTKTIGKSAFEGCTSLKDVTFWGGENIGENAFKACTSLKEVSIPSETKKIGNNAFYNCTSLEDVTIWNDDTKIGKNAFGNTPYFGDVSETSTQSTSSTVEWRQFLKEYEEWVDDYIVILKKYKKNPSDISILSDYTEMVTELAEWTTKTENMEKELENASPSELAEYSAELLRIAGKMSEVAY